MVAAAIATVQGTATAAQAATVAATAAMAAGGTSAYMSYQQGKAAEQEGKYNAELAAREAESVKEASAYEERESRIEGRQLRARQLLDWVGGGLPPVGRTLLNVQSQTAAKTEQNIAMQKYGYGLQESRSMSQAKLYKMMGKSKSRASRWQAGSSLLTGAYRASSVYN